MQHIPATSTSDRNTKEKSKNKATIVFILFYIISCIPPQNEQLVCMSCCWATVSHSDSSSKRRLAFWATRMNTAAYAQRRENSSMKLTGLQITQNTIETRNFYRWRILLIATRVHDYSWPAAQKIGTQFFTLHQEWEDEQAHNLQGKYELNIAKNETNLHFHIHRWCNHELDCTSMERYFRERTIHAVKNPW